MTNNGKKLSASQMLANAFSQPQVVETHKGASTYNTSGTALYDFFSTASAMRARPDDAVDLFKKAFAEASELAVRALFYLRDIRGGQGEREIFRRSMAWLSNNYPNDAAKVLQHIPTYGRWDDLLTLIATSGMFPVVSQAEDMVKKQYFADATSAKPSLLAKWLPSENASKKETINLAKKMHKILGVSPRIYRRTLSKLRAKLNIVEIPMSARNWGAIDYSKVASRAGLIYKNAFKKQDGTRYEAHIQSVLQGTAKINSGTLYPYDIVSKYRKIGSFDTSFEAMWKSLPNYVTKPSNTMAVVDSSGSMTSHVHHQGNGTTAPSFSPLDVAIGLAIYFAERNTGVFNNKAMRFSNNADLVTLTGGLLDKISQMNNGYVGTTNLEAVFDKILTIALTNRVSPADMVDNLLIISDMEFDSACETTTNTKSVFMTQMQHKYAAVGYNLPRIIFWNVNAYGSNFPVKADSQGMVMVSGASPSAFKFVLENKLETPQELMLSVLNGPRYGVISI